MTLINFGNLSVVAQHIVYIQFVSENNYKVMLSSSNSFDVDEEIKNKIVEVLAGIN
jgi:hypothetical protein